MERSPGFQGGGLVTISPWLASVVSSLGVASCSLVKSRLMTQVGQSFLLG